MSSVAHVNGIDLSYVYDDVGGPTVLIIMGLGANISNSASTIDALKGAGFSTLMIDNRGAGDTSGYDIITVDSIADDIDALLEHLSIPKVYVFAHSFGTSVAQSLAYRYPDRVIKMALSGSYRHRPERFAYIARTIFQQHLEDDPSIFGILLNAFAYDRMFFERIRISEKEVRVFVPKDVKGLMAQIRCLDDHDTTEIAPMILCPVLSIHGADDMMVDPMLGDQLAELLPDCTVLRVSGSGHIIPMKRIIDDIKEFFQS